MHMTLTANMELIISMQRNGRDIRPLAGWFLGSIGIGPDKKNFVIPKELAQMLRINVIKGRAW